MEKDENEAYEWAKQAAELSASGLLSFTCPICSSARSKFWCFQNVWQVLSNRLPPVARTRTFASTLISLMWRLSRRNTRFQSACQMPHKHLRSSVFLIHILGQEGNQGKGNVFGVEVLKFDEDKSGGTNSKLATPVPSWKGVLFACIGIIQG